MEAHSVASFAASSTTNKPLNHERNAQLNPALAKTANMFSSLTNSSPFVVESADVLTTNQK